MDLDVLKLPIRTKPTLYDVFQALNLLGTLPQDILFTPGARTTPRRTGFNWAPLSFLRRDRNEYSSDQKPAKLTQRGLQVEKHGILLTEALLFQPLDRPQVENPGCFAIVHGNRKPFRYFFLDDGAKKDPAQTKPRSIDDAALIFMNEPARGGSAILVEQVQEESGVRYARYVAKVKTMEAGYWESTLDLEAYMAADRLSINSVSGTAVTESTWCVD